MSASLPAWGRRHTVLLYCFLAVVIAYTDRVNISVASVAMAAELGWDQTTKGVVLSSFFVGYMLFMIASGWLAVRYGGRRVLAAAVVWWSAFTLLTPIAAGISTEALIAARVLMGAGEAAVLPATLAILGQWAPPVERTRAVSRMLSGIPVGQVVGFLATGWIVAQWGWPPAFYGFGLLGFVWAAGWLRCTAEDPAVDPRIAAAEVALLRADAPISQPSGGGLLRHALGHSSVWAIVVVNFCTNWGLFFLLAWLPSYFHDVHGFGYSGAGLASALPWVAALLASNVAANLSDRAIRRGADVTRVRKISQSVGLGAAALFLLACQGAATPWLALGLVCGAAGSLGVSWSSYAPNMLDLSPRYAAIIGGLSNTVATLPGVVGVALTGWLVDTTGTYAVAFAVAALVSIGGAAFYLVFGSGRSIGMENRLT